MGRSAHIMHAEIEIPDNCDQVKEELKETKLALNEATDNIEQARALCKQQIERWRAEKPPRSWTWIKRQPAAKAFYGPLSGS